VNPTTAAGDPDLRRQIACVLLGLVLVVPSVGGGFMGDDYLQIAQLEGWSVNPASPLDLYAFTPRDPAVMERLRQDGLVPYFAAPGLKLAFFRPLSSALLWLDHSLFGRWAVPYHVHTLLWYAGLLVAAAALLRRTLSPGLATLGLLVFCLDDGHSMAAGWIAARNATVACTLVFLALLAHIRWRTEGWRAGALLSPLAAALGLAAGEMALGALAYLVAWELVQRRAGRARALAPTLILIAVYLVVHRLTGSGARDSGQYLDPFGDPLRFAWALPERALLLVGNLLLGAPIDFVQLDARLRLPLLGVGAGAVLGLALWLPRALRRMTAEEARGVRWLAWGAAGALLAGTPALLGERVLLAASLGGAAVVAALLRDAWRLWRARRARVTATIAIALLGLPHLALGVVTLPAKTIFVVGLLGESSRKLAREAEISAPVPARAVVIALEDLSAIHLPAVRAFEQGLEPERLRRFWRDRERGVLPLPDRMGYQGSTVLSLATTGHNLRRTAGDAFQLSTPGGTLLDGPWASCLRHPSLALPRGTVISLRYMTATVLDDRGGVPTRVELRFDRPLEDPSLIFLVFSEGRLRRFTFPPMGQEITLPRAQPLVPRENARDHD
jgi:hypothetical protein